METGSRKLIWWTSTALVEFFIKLNISKKCCTQTRGKVKTLSLKWMSLQFHKISLIKNFKIHFFNTINNKYNKNRCTLFSSNSISRCDVMNKRLSYRREDKNKFHFCHSQTISSVLPKTMKSWLNSWFITWATLSLTNYFPLVYAPDNIQGH